MKNNGASYSQWHVKCDEHEGYKQPRNIHTRAAAAAAKLLQLCPTLCDPIDGSPSGSPSLGFSR